MTDRTTADDLLGTVEVDLKELMMSTTTKGQMDERTDDFTEANGSDKKVPGTLHWHVGYFPKADVTQNQLNSTTAEANEGNVSDLKNAAAEESMQKLREAPKGTRNEEAQQQQREDMKAKTDQVISQAPLDPNLPSGIFSVCIHEIVGLELQNVRQEKPRTGEDNMGEDEEGEVDDLPSCYCTVIVNHKIVYKTRTKPKTSNPFVSYP